jgi:dTDP-4-dehydrorhamnose 3,5-epimerase
MIISDTPVSGSFLIRPERHEDERGFFARTYCSRELREYGIDPTVVQRSVSYNHAKGTLRGLHYQSTPGEENKFVTCVRGSVFDVAVDIRPDSPTYRRWAAVTLTADGMETLFIPKGCAHGFITLSDGALVQYDISDHYVPELARGIRYDDPAFDVKWPLAPVVVNARDLGFPRFVG